MSELPEVLSAIVVGPDDRLVIVLPKATDPMQLDLFRCVLDQRDWGDRVLIVAGVEELAVLRGEVGP